MAKRDKCEAAAIKALQQLHCSILTHHITSVLLKMMKSHIHFAILVQPCKCFTTMLRLFCWQTMHKHKTKQRQACEGDAEAAPLFQKVGVIFTRTQGGISCCSKQLVLIRTGFIFLHTERKFLFLLENIISNHLQQLETSMQLTFSQPRTNVTFPAGCSSQW